MNTKKPISDDALVEATRHAVSRRQDIPPTPRDTMAVIMQAADQKRESAARPIIPFPVFRWAAVAACALVLAAGIARFRDAGAPQTAEVSAPAASPIDDLGLDVAAWDMEIDSLLSDLDASLASISTDDFAMLDL